MPQFYKHEENMISETLQPPLQRNKYILFTHTCCLPVKSLHCTAGSPPSLPAPLTSQDYSQLQPPIAACQMPASDIVHHCAGVSGANCHLFFPMLLMRRGSKKQRNTLGEERYGQCCQPVLEIIKAYTC